MNRNIITSSLIFISLGIVHAESFNNLAQALASPERVTSLSIKEFDPNMKHLPPKLGALINLKELEISCLENLEDIPVEIGQLKKLEIGRASCRERVEISDAGRGVTAMR